MDLDPEREQKRQAWRDRIKLYIARKVIRECGTYDNEDDEIEGKN